VLTHPTMKLYYLLTLILVVYPWGPTYASVDRIELIRSKLVDLLSRLPATDQDLSDLMMRVKAVTFNQYGDQKDSCPGMEVRGNKISNDNFGVYASANSELFPFQINICAHFANTFSFEKVAHVLLHETAHLIRGHEKQTLREECEAENLALSTGHKLHRYFPNEFAKVLPFSAYQKTCKRKRY
jgi:hypothetical protein